MTLPEDLDKLLNQLDPATRVVFSLLQNNNEELTESNKKLTEEVSRLTRQVEKFQKMLFGSKSEKLPPIVSEIRRVVKAEELMAEDHGGESGSEPKDETEQEAETRRRKREEPGANLSEKRTVLGEKICPSYRKRSLLKLTICQRVTLLMSWQGRQWEKYHTKNRACPGAFGSGGV